MNDNPKKSIVKLPVKPQPKEDVKKEVRRSTAMPSAEDSTIDITLTPATKKSSKLKLNTEGYKPAKTRSELYRELAEKENVVLEDVCLYPNPFERGIALLVDAAFIFGLAKIAIFLSAFELKLTDYFFNAYKLQFMFSEKLLLKMLIGGTFFFIFFCAVILPMAFFNTSLGKRMTKLRVRGDEHYTISVSAAFKRELICKPISIACLAGFVLPFFNKEKKSLHDLMMGTFVVKD